MHLRTFVGVGSVSFLASFAFSVLAEGGGMAGAMPDAMREGTSKASSQALALSGHRPVGESVARIGSRNDFAWQRAAGGVQGARPDMANR